MESRLILVHKTDTYNSYLKAVWKDLNSYMSNGRQSSFPLKKDMHY